MCKSNDLILSNTVNTCDFNTSDSILSCIKEDSMNCETTHTSVLGRSYSNCTERNEMLPEVVPTDGKQYDIDTVTNGSECETFYQLREYKVKYAKCLIVSYLNINSLFSKFSEFSQCLIDELVDIVCIAETKLDDTILDSAIHVRNYKLYRQDGTRQAHGLAVYVKSDLTHCRRTDLESCISGNGQNIIIELWLRKQKWFFVFLYKPPSECKQNFINGLSMLSDKLLCESSDIVVTGDVNIDMKNDKDNVLVEFCSDYCFKNMVNKPTCFKSITNESLIDVILASKPRRLNETLVFDCGLSDCHRMISVSTKINVPRREPRKISYRSFKNFNEESFRSDVESTPFHVSHIFEDIDDITWCHERLFLSVIDDHAPLKQKTLKKDSLPFMNSEWRKVIHRRNQLRNKFWKNRTSKNWEEYRSMRNLANKLRRKSEIYYFNQRTIKTDPVDFWKTFKPYLSSKSIDTGNNIILKENGEVVSKPSKVCEILRDYYETIVDDIGEPDNLEDEVDEVSIESAIQTHAHHPSILEIKGKHPAPECFNFKMVTTSQVLKKLSTIQLKKATGYDNVAPFFLKVAANELAKPIAQIVNTCMEQGKYPNSLKKNEVVPVYKSKDSFNKVNYRPVSCTVALSKVIEKLIASQVTGHFNNYFDDRLSAYRKGTGCEHVIVSVVEDWKKALDENKVVGSLLMDLSKAFDCLPHKLLVAKLRAYGFSIKACSLLASYLTNRKQRVRYFGVHSTWSDVKKGIPQGSVLGPLMYNIFVNDLMYVVVENFYNYADDNTIAVIDKDVNKALDRLKVTASKCIEWFSANMMKANPEKFQLVILNRRELTQDLSINLNGIQIKQVNSVKLLGMHIDVNLDFCEHVTILCKKASRNLKILLRLSKNLPNVKDRYCLMESFLLSCFNYCQIVWHFCNKAMSSRIEKLYERGIRFAENDYVTDYSELLKKAGKSTFLLTRLKNIAIFVFNCIEENSPMYLNQIYKLKESRYAMRSDKIIDISRFNTNKYGKMSLRYTGCKMWNSLPNVIKCHDEVTKFKHDLNRWNCQEIRCNKCEDFIYH